MWNSCLSYHDDIPNKGFKSVKLHSNIHSHKTFSIRLIVKYCVKHISCVERKNTGSEFISNVSNALTRRGINKDARALHLVAKIKIYKQLKAKLSFNLVWRYFHSKYIINVNNISRYTIIWSIWIPRLQLSILW